MSGAEIEREKQRESTKMDHMIQQQLVNAASELENQLDSELNALDAMTGNELQTLRNQRINEMKNLAKKKQEWLNNGHGSYEELSGEKEFFEVSKKSANIVAHFYRDATERCKIVDHHLKILAKQHLEAKFCKVNAENSPFLTQRLRIKVIPTIAIIKDSKTKDYIVGFTDLGNRDDFSTEMMEWRIAQSGAIEYNVSMPGAVPPDSCLSDWKFKNLIIFCDWNLAQGDLLTPPDQARKEKNLLRQQKKKIRGTVESDDSDIDFND